MTTTEIAEDKMKVTRQNESMINQQRPVYSPIVIVERNNEEKRDDRKETAE